MASDTATNAAPKAALEALQPVADDPSIREIIVALTGEAEGEDDARLEKALSGIAQARVSLEKDESVSPAQAFEVGQRLVKAERALQTEYMRRHSVGFGKAEANNREAARLHER